MPYCYEFVWQSVICIDGTPCSFHVGYSTHTLAVSNAGWATIARASHFRIGHERCRFVSETSCVTRSLNIFIVNDGLIEKTALLCGIKNCRSVPDRHPWYRAKPRTSDIVTFIVRVRRFTVNVLYDWGVGSQEPTYRLTGRTSRIRILRPKT